MVNRLPKNVRLLVDVKDSDIDYCCASRLSNEPFGGVNDIHLHPTLPRTARVKYRARYLSSPAQRSAT